MNQQPTTTDHVNNFVERLNALGREKQLGLGAIAFALVGFFLPLATAQTGGYFGASSEVSYGLEQAGFSGVLLLAAALALGAIPFYLASNKRNNVVAYGLAAALFGTFLSVWFISFSLPAMISAIGHLAIGFFCMLLSFGISTYIGGSRCYDKGSE